MPRLVEAPVAAGRNCRRLGAALGVTQDQTHGGRPSLPFLDGLTRTDQFDGPPASGRQEHQNALHTEGVF
jgi:hypothetical protein